MENKNSEHGTFEQINVSFFNALQGMVDVAHKENENKYNILAAIASVTINEVEYQIQLSLIADKKLQIRENDIVLSECVKVHN